MRNATRRIATAAATAVIAIGVVAITSVPAHAASDSSWGYVKAPTGGGSGS